MLLLPIAGTAKRTKLNTTTIFFSAPLDRPLGLSLALRWSQKTIKTVKQKVVPANSKDSQEDKIKHDYIFFSAPLDRPLGLSLALRWSQKDNKNVQAKCCSCQ